MLHAILGAGQIGQAIAKHLEAGTYTMCEPNTWENGQWAGTDNLHVCIPYDTERQFVGTVMLAALRFEAKKVIIHSTVPPGTTKKVVKELGDYECNVYYSPVVGRHDHGFQLDTFKKLYAGPDHKCPMGQLTKYNDWDSNTCWGKDTESLEFAKVMSTAYMYWNLMFQKELYRICLERGYKFEDVYKKWNDNYNWGYSNQQNGKQFVRPVFQEVDLELAGGHCLRPNLHLDDNIITKMLLEWERKVEDDRVSRQS